jgi:mono/diheme cytochrome c family protein
VNRLSLGFATIAIAAGLAVCARAAEPDVFGARCVICHQSTAQGVPGVYPPLADSIGNDVRFNDGRDYLIHVVLDGLSGPIEVAGTTYDGLMPRFSQMTDAEIAAVLNEVLTHYNANEIPKNFAPITAAEVARARATPRSPDALDRERTSLMKRLKDPPTDTAEHLYMLNCWGCHRPHGEGIPGTAPPLRGAADFLRVPGGRQYLIEVPGVAQSALDDAQVAAVMNWIIESFSADRMPSGFQPYTRDEIAKYRATRLMDIKDARAKLVGEMAAMKIRPAEK